MPLFYYPVLTPVTLLVFWTGHQNRLDYIINKISVMSWGLIGHTHDIKTIHPHFHANRVKTENNRLKK